LFDLLVSLDHYILPAVFYRYRYATFRSLTQFIYITMCLTPLLPPSFFYFVLNFFVQFSKILIVNLNLILTILTDSKCECNFD